MMLFFKKLFSHPQDKPRLGLISCLNNRGLGTEARLLQTFFSKHIPEIDFNIFEIRAGKTSQAFDDNWQNNKKFKKWLHKQDHVMTIEHFMPKLFSECKKLNIDTIWRPNIEWIDCHLTQVDFEKVDTIVTPIEACTELLRGKFNLTNVCYIPWIADLPIQSKEPRADKTTFIFNAGRGGVADRRNAEAVINAFGYALKERSDIKFILKTQIALNISELKPYLGQNFIYHHKNTSYKRNLRFYHNADFSIAPSKWEGVGFSLLESLHHGTPVLTVDAPPMNQWIEHKTLGYTVPAHYSETELPIPFDRSQAHLGLNWVKAANCNTKDLVKGICWLADNKKTFYKNFNQKNYKILNARKEAFTSAWRDLLGLS